MSAQNLDKIGPKKKNQADVPNPKEVMKYVQYFPDQSPQTNTKSFPSLGLLDSCALSLAISPMNAFINIED